MSGGTRAPTRPSARRPAPARRRLRAPRSGPWLVVALLALAIVGLVIALLADGDEPQRSPSVRAAAVGTPIGRVMATPLATGDSPSAISIGTETVWVVNEVAGTAISLDPTSNAVLGDPVRVGGRPRFMRTGAGAL
jgi:streptogramin lyase